MISMKDMLLGKNFDSLTDEQKYNLPKVLDAVNKLKVEWDKHCLSVGIKNNLIFTSCVRTMQEHLNIYAKKGITDKSKIPMRSKHLLGAALDIADNGLVMTKWLKDNPKIMEDCDIFCELGNSNWVHLQVQSFGSYKNGGTRWFAP